MNWSKENISQHNQCKYFKDYLKKRLRQTNTDINRRDLVSIDLKEFENRIAHSKLESTVKYERGCEPTP